jgi:hypothetical protein
MAERQRDYLRHLRCLRSWYALDPEYCRLLRLGLGEHFHLQYVLVMREMVRGRRNEHWPI